MCVRLSLHQGKKVCRSGFVVGLFFSMKLMELINGIVALTLSDSLVLLNVLFHSSYFNLESLMCTAITFNSCLW